MADSFPEYPATAPRRAQSVLPRPSRLGQTLREARQDTRLELEDVADTTGIAPAYLEALEAGRLSELPGDPHGKNFVRRYANAVGLDPARIMVLYAQERRNLSVAVYSDTASGPRGLELPATEDTFTVHPRFRRSLRLFTSLLLVAAASWLALRVFDGALLPGGRSEPGVQTQPAQPLGVDATATATPTTTAPAMILFSLQTTPPGAEVSIDGYRFGQSPIIDAPVRAGKRTLKIEHGGYGTFERTLDLGRDRRFNVTLSPRGVGTPNVVGTASAVQATPRPGVSATPTQVVVSVTAEAWLEVYQGAARGGERLVYETAQPGDVYTFSTPVYVFSGNAGGVSVARGDAPAQPLGAPGAVVGAAYGQP